MIKIINKILRCFKIIILRKTTFDHLITKDYLIQIIELLKIVKKKQINYILNNFKYSKAQLFQDFFVLSQLNFRKKGFFVEFGATNGFDLSNTFLLEKKFGWRGILCEPAKIWHKELKKKRKVKIETKCVWKKSNLTLTFNEANIAELSTIKEYSSSDCHKNNRKGNSYTVETVSLEDLLNKYKAPKIIDYLSIDTEGSEFEILSVFNFNKYKFRVITCEHNYTANRRKVFLLLTKYGYKRKFKKLSKFDDWYVLNK
jgi:FkbM family methyltransferase